jgi:putative beta-1,4-xylosyltransferase IRX9
MGTGTGAGAAPDRAKQRRASAGGHLWKKALLHFSLCFVMGFFTGFAPSSSWKAASTHPPHRLAASRVAVDVDVDARTSLVPPADAVSSSSSSVATVDVGDDDAEGGQRRLLIVVTTTRSAPGARRRRRGELLRLAHTLRLVRPPVVWVVVEPAADAPATAEVLRGTGVMYRHLAFRPEGNLTAAGAGAEAHAQRNAALAHVERHRLAGVLHFADAAAVYDVGFFDQIRQIESVPPPPPTPSAPFLRFYVVFAFSC